jgi:hypothetical protein
MFLVELVLQGVRGIRSLIRLRFQSGFNFVAAGNEAGKTTAVDTMQRLLYPNNQDRLLQMLVSKHAPDASRAALVMHADDTAYYRIIQDFSKCAVNVSKYNTATKDFILMHKDWDSAVQFMNGITTGVPEEDFARVFILRRDHSGGPEVAVPVDTTAHRTPAGKPAASSGGKTATNKARLAELRETLKKAEDAADAEYRAQSAKLALDDIKKKLASLDEIDQKKDEIELTLAGLKGCETLPENLSELLDAHEQRQGKKLADADELNKELEGLKMQLVGIPTVNLFTDVWFIAGAAFGTLSILAGVFVLTAEQAMYFPIGVLLSLGLMALAWYNGSRKNTQRKTVMSEAEALEKDIAELEKRFEQEGAAIRACMKSTGSSTAGELKEKAENFRYFQSMRDDIEERRKRVLGDLTPEILQQEYNKQQQEALDLEKAARAVAQFNIDTYSIRQDIERLEAESSPDASWDFGAGAQAEPPSQFEVPVTGGGQRGFHATLGIASRIGGIEMEMLVTAVEAAAQRNLTAVTGGKYIKVEVGENDGSLAVRAKDDSAVSYAELSHGTRDLVTFCLRTALVEVLAGKRRLPFILDDSLAAFDPARQKAACQVLRSLGAKVQVILFSSNPALRADSDAVAELK